MENFKTFVQSCSVKRPLVTNDTPFPVPMYNNKSFVVAQVQAHLWIDLWEIWLENKKKFQEKYFIKREDGQMCLNEDRNVSVEMTLYPEDFIFHDQVNTSADFKKLEYKWPPPITAMYAGPIPPLFLKPEIMWASRVDQITPEELFTRPGVPFNTHICRGEIVWDLITPSYQPKQPPLDINSVNKKRERVKYMLQLRLKNPEEAYNDETWNCFGQEKTKDAWTKFAPEEYLGKEGLNWYPSRLLVALNSAKTGKTLPDLSLPPIRPNDQKEAKEILDNIENPDYLKELVNESRRKKLLTAGWKHALGFLRRIELLEECEAKLNSLSESVSTVPVNRIANHTAIFGKFSNNAQKIAESESKASCEEVRNVNREWQTTTGEY